MSRAYEMAVEVKSDYLSEDDVRNVLVDVLGWAEDNLEEYEGIIRFDGNGFLCGGQSEEEAHKEIESLFLKINPKIKIQSRWTYMEDLPFEIYGEL